MAKGKKGFQPGNRHGRLFSSTRQPKKNGRKPALYKRIKLINNDLSKEEYANLMLSLMECSISQLEKIKAECYKPNSKFPIWIASLIAAIKADIKKGRIDSFQWVLDRAFGKPGSVSINTQINQVNNNGVCFNFSALSNEELEQFMVLIDKMDGKMPSIRPFNPTGTVPKSQALSAPECNDPSIKSRENQLSDELPDHLSNK